MNVWVISRVILEPSCERKSAWCQSGQLELTEIHADYRKAIDSIDKLTLQYLQDWPDYLVSTNQISAIDTFCVLRPQTNNEWMAFWKSISNDDLRYMINSLEIAPYILEEYDVNS